jgi:hypothetical protein
LRLRRDFFISNFKLNNTHSSRLRLRDNFSHRQLLLMTLRSPPPPAASMPIRSLADRLHQNTHQLLGPQADFVSRQPEDAGIAGAEHLDPDARPQSELFQTMNVFPPAQQPADATGLPGGQVL